MSVLTFLHRVAATECSPMIARTRFCLLVLSTSTMSCRIRSVFFSRKPCVIGRETAGGDQWASKTQHDMAETRYVYVCTYCIHTYVHIAYIHMYILHTYCTYVHTLCTYVCMYIRIAALHDLYCSITSCDITCYIHTWPLYVRMYAQQACTNACTHT